MSGRVAALHCEHPAIGAFPTARIPLKKSAKPDGAPSLNKLLFEAGQQCHKRLWLDVHDPLEPLVSSSRREMSRIGAELRELARTAFPMGVAITQADGDEAAEATAAELAAGAPVLFDAAFAADGVEARCDILVVHKDRRVDLFEIKSGTKVKQRYVHDLALQANVLAASGYELQRAYLLHVNPRYLHSAGADYPPMELLRSSDVTSKVVKQQPNVARKLQELQRVIDADDAPTPPMGTYCTTPFPCPHGSRCAAAAPALPLTKLPELTRQLEAELHREGVEDLAAVDPEREGLTFRQRRALQCHAQGERIVEPLLREELAACEHPLHFLAVAVITDPLPIFGQQRPWQRTPFAWGLRTRHADGRVEEHAFTQVDRDDPRSAFLKSLSRQLEVGGTVVVWGEECLTELRPLLDTLPDEKSSVRALLGSDHLDLRALFESTIFDAELTSFRDIATVVAALLDDPSGADLAALDPDARFELVQKARTPRVRVATREKIAATVADALRWQAERLAALFETFAAEA